MALYNPPEETRIEFDRMDAVKEIYETWWEGALDRPLVNLVVVDPPQAAVERIGPEPPLPYRKFTGTYGIDVSPQRIVDRWDWELGRRRYVADGYPSMWPNFGPGVLAAFLGARMIGREETIWFAPDQVETPDQLQLRFDPSNSVFSRVSEIVRCATELWNGRAQVGMTDLGGTLDVVQSFRPGELLATDLYDFPEEIERLSWEAHDGWFDAFERLAATAGSRNPGYSAWTALLSARSYYMLQCDFSYMISPAMFEQFVLPELSASCRRIDRPFYHLDGPGQLPHLQTLLSIPELKGIQWVPGDGAPDVRHWPEVYRAITDAGKLIEVNIEHGATSLGVLDELAEQIGSLGHVALVGEVAAGEEEQAARRILERHGVPW